MQQPPNHHLAELNIGRIKYDIDDPRMAGFTNNLARVNGIAERSPGFIWRYTDESGNATNTRPYADPRIIVNVSVWESVGGRLRLLRSGNDLDDMVLEVPPEEGTLLAFKRSDNSWHGHKSFAGERRVLQFNWVTSGEVVRREQGRHRFSATIKKIFGAIAARL